MRSSRPDPGDRAEVAELRCVAMSDSDLQQVVEIERGSFGSPWKLHHFRHELHGNPFALNLVMRRGELVLGYACCWLLGDELKINNIAVRPDFRGLGIGGRLLRELLERARDQECLVASLEVRPSNRDAVEMYRKHGFVHVGIRKGYYAVEGEDALVLERTL